MSADSTLAVQKAVIAALKADTTVSGIVAKRVYDAVPTGVQKPYLSFGPTQVLPDIAEEYEGSEVTFQIDGWSEGPKSVEAKQIGAAVRNALSGVELSLGDDQHLVNIEIIQTNYLPEPNGITQHAALTFRARTEPTT
jgi:hypothetical protein